MSTDSTAQTECNVTTTPTVYASATLGSSTTAPDGVVYDSGLDALRLDFEGGLFSSDVLNISPPGDIIVSAAAGDFDNDGQEDFVGGMSSGLTFLYLNQSDFASVNPTDWDNPSFVLPPQFARTPVPTITPDLSNTKMVVAAGDFDGKGGADIVRINIDGSDNPQSAQIWLNSGSTDDAPNFALPYSPMSTASLGAMPGRGTNIVAVDYDGDFRLDLLIGSAAGTGGTIHRFRNVCTPDPSATPDPFLDCQDNPTFVADGNVISNLNMGAGALPVFAFADFDGDNVNDLVVGAPVCCAAATDRLRLWKGIVGGNIDTLTEQSIGFVGAATFVLAADFSLDGRNDLIVGTDDDNSPGVPGGQSFYYHNNRSDTPFSDPFKTQITNNGSPEPDFELGIAINYDNDPDSTIDVLMADDVDVTDFHMFANRVSPTDYVECSAIESEVVDLASLGLDTTEMEVLRARLEVDASLNGGTIEWFVANEPVPNWLPATTPCVDDPADYCKTFANPAGRDLRWRAELCAAPGQLTTPHIDQVKLTFDYNEAEAQFRAGAVVSDGVAYVASFTSLGNRGRLFAVNAALDTVYWEAGAKLDAMADSERNIYTTQFDGTSRLDFQYSGNPVSDAPLQATMAVPLPALVEWVRSKRFGVGNAGLGLSALGSIERSTPAVVTAPGLPIWYTLASDTDRSQVDAFISANSDRKPLVLTGSRAGMLHAFYTDPVNITDPKNGTEAWAFVPFPVANTLFNDYFATLSSSGANPNVSTLFPDGPPSIADVKIGGALRTLAVVAEGTGGKNLSALDITETIDSGGSVVGPDPLWYARPIGGSGAGLATPKPVIARVLIGTERFIVIAATGLDPTGAPTDGRIVEAYDVETGAVLWRFRSQCPITSDLVVYETNDDGEVGSPEVDGYMDRLAFADQCGYVYKLDPARELATTDKWNDNTSLFAPPSTNVGFVTDSFIDSDSNPITFKAMFSTELTPSAYVADTNNDADGVDPDNDTDGLAPDTDLQRPIVGTIAVRTDNTARTVLFFGTGGLQSEDVAYHNEFYAIYSDTGAIRSKYVGACSPTPRRCEKFYGGVVVTTEQVIFTRTIDAVDACDPGSSEIVFAAIDDSASSPGEFDFEAIPSVAIPGAAVSSLFGDAGAIYVATLGGQIVRIGTPRAADAGGDSASGAGGGIGGGNEGGVVGIDRPMVLMGWRQVF